MAKILITGGSGLVGRAVSELLLNSGHQPAWLSREASASTSILQYKWDISGSYIDKKAFEGVEAVVHLAGAGIVDHRWTPAYKQEIIDSRVKSSALLYDYISKNNYPVKTLVGSSAVGYYGARQNNLVFTEEDFPGTDFLSKTCALWEKSYTPFQQLGIRTAVIRTGLVLSREGGFYKKMAPLFRVGLGAALGRGKQYMPWIHIHDIAAMYKHLLFTTQLSGAYNGVATELINNRDFSKKLAESLNKPFFLPPVPSFALRLALGESAATVTEGLRISNQKVKGSGFRFKFEKVADALHHLAEKPVLL